MATWKKVIVSGSSAELANVKNTGIAQHTAVIGGGQAGNQTGVALNDGQLLIGATGAAPTAASLTSATATESGSIRIDKSANTIKLRVDENTLSVFNLSGSTADYPSAGQTVKIAADGKHFTFDDASTVLSAGLGVTITNNKISSSIANPGSAVSNPGQSFGTAGSTQFTGSLKGDVVGNVTGDLTGTATNATNVTTTTDDTDVEAFITFGPAAAATQGLVTNANIKANLVDSGITATSFTGSLKGDVDGNAATATSATTATTANGLASNATGTNLVLSGDLTVNGTTTEVRTENLNVRDKLITLSSGSSTAINDVVSFSSGLVFAGARIGAYAGSRDAETNNSGSALFVDGATQRLTVTTDGIGSTDTSLDATGTRRAHIPLVFTGSAVAHAAGQQIGNFKVDAAGEFYVYTA